MSSPAVGPALLGLLLLASMAPSGAEEVTGEAVYKYCIACHGKRAAGGENGKYPRIAGLPADYLARQLNAFKTQSRLNKPMIPIFKHHRFDTEVISTLSTYLSEQPVPKLSLWPYEPDPAALEQFGSGAGVLDSGRDLYLTRCAQCHAKSGRGIAGQGPPLVAQYPSYLKKQLGDFARGERTHDAAERCAGVSPTETEAILSHLVVLGK